MSRGGKHTATPARDWKGASPTHTHTLKGRSKFIRVVSTCLKRRKEGGEGKGRDGETEEGREGETESWREGLGVKGRVREGGDMIDEEVFVVEC